MKRSLRSGAPPSERNCASLGRLLRTENRVEVMVLSALIELPWAQLIINGLALGSLYALAAFGIVLISRMTDVITF